MRTGGWLAFALTLSAMAVVFLLTVNKVQLDRVQENVYLGVPYNLLQQGRFVVMPDADPFPENGPQAIYPPTALLKATGSLFLMRAYQFLFPLLVVGLLLFLFLRKFGERIPSIWEQFLLAGIFLAVWISTPNTLIYPIQVNGMAAGFACLLLGAYVFPRSAVWGMFCFGWAFTFKGQYLAMLPGFIFYVLFVDVRERNIWKHFLLAIGAVAMFFVPKSVIVSGLCWALGMFEDKGDFLRYSLDGPHLIGYEISYVIGRLLGKAAAAAPEEGSRRAVEYAGYGMMAWAHIGLSVGFSVLFALRSLWHRVRTPLGAALSIDTGLTALAWGGLVYWINYLFFYRFPYWYNVFALVFFNIYLFASVVVLSRDQIVRLTGPRWGRVFFVLAGLSAFVLFSGYLRRQISLPPGNAFAPYEWMKAE